RELGSYRSEVRERPDRIIEDGTFDARISEFAPLAAGKLGSPHQFTRHRLYLARCRQRIDQPLLKLLVHLILQLMGKITPIGKRQHTYLTLIHAHLLNGLEGSKFKVVTLNFEL